MKKMTTLLAGVLAVAAFGAVAQAETRLAVQDATGTTDKMVVTDLGKIGVGTSNPNGGVHIVAPDIGTAQIVTHYSGPTSASAGGSFMLMHNNAAGAFPSSADRLGYLTFGSYDYANPASLVAKFGASITARAAGNWNASSTPTNMTFETADTSGGRVERIRIFRNGNVGIGATAPTQKLEVNGALRLNPAASGTNNNIAPTQPACDATARGTFWFAQGAAGVADSLVVCIKTSNDAVYAWRTVSMP